MIPRHKIFHIVFFVLALNFLLGCPTANALTGDTLHLSCSVSSSADVKKKYCQADTKHENTPSFVLTAQYTLFFNPAPNRRCIRTAFPLSNIPTPFETSMRLNL